MVTTFAPANLQWFGAARETTYGTPVATPTYYMPADSPQYHRIIPPLTDGNLRGSMATDYAQIGGIMYDQFGCKVHCHLDSAFFLLRCLLGYPDVVTGSSDPYTHKTALQNGGNNGQPVSSTIFWADAAGKVQQIAGAQMSDLKVAIKQDGLVEFDITFIGLPAATITPPTNSPTTTLPMPSWNTQVTLGGTALSKYSEINLDFKRATEVIPTLTGSQTPFAIFAGPVSVSGDMTAVFQGATADTDWTNYLANTQPVLLTQTGPQGDATHYVKLQMSKIAYDDVQVSGTNKWMEIKSTIKALANATDALDGLLSPAQAICTTAVSTAI